MSVVTRTEVDTAATYFLPLQPRLSYRTAAMLRQLAENAPAAAVEELTAYAERVEQRDLSYSDERMEAARSIAYLFLTHFPNGNDCLSECILSLLPEEIDLVSWLEEQRMTLLELELSEAMEIAGAQRLTVVEAVWQRAIVSIDSVAQQVRQEVTQHLQTADQRAEQLRGQVEASCGEVVMLEEKDEDSTRAYRACMETAENQNTSRVHMLQSALRRLRRRET